MDFQRVFPRSSCLVGKGRARRVSTCMFAQISVSLLLHCHHANTPSIFPCLTSYVGASAALRYLDLPVDYVLVLATIHKSNFAARPSPVLIDFSSK